MNQLKAPADDAGSAKQRQYLVGRGVGGDVEILRFQTDDEVAHGAADDEGLESVLMQDLAHLDRVARDIQPELGRESGRVGVGKYVSVCVVAVYIKNNKQ